MRWSGLAVCTALQVKPQGRSSMIRKAQQWPPRSSCLRASSDLREGSSKQPQSSLPQPYPVLLYMMVVSQPLPSPSHSTVGDGCLRIFNKEPHSPTTRTNGSPTINGSLDCPSVPPQAPSASMLLGLKPKSRLSESPDRQPYRLRSRGVSKVVP